MTTTRHTEELLKKGEERKRLTSQLQEALSSVADEIARSVPLGTKVAAAGRTYKTFEKRSNLGTCTYLGIYEPNDYDGEYNELAAFESFGAVGDWHYLHNDFSVTIQTANRESFLHFANNLPEAIAAFEANQQDAIDALRAAFERLRMVAESKN